MQPRHAAIDVLARTRPQLGRNATLQLTDRCNYSCVHCYQEHDAKGELGFSDWNRIMEELADAGVLFLTLMGGELFMHRDADALLTRAHELNFVIRVKSTGHHIHDRRADLLADLKPIHVDLSLYGSRPEVHEAITSHAGSWKRTRDAAIRLIHRGVPVQLNVPIMNSNVDDLTNIVELAESLGAEFALDPKIRGMETGDDSPIELRMSWGALEGFYRSTVVAKYLHTTFQRLRVRRDDQPSCGAGTKTVYINPQGELWPCGALPVVCGDLRTQSIEEILNSNPTLDRVRNLTWGHLPECASCTLRKYCGRCHGAALVEHGDMTAATLEACRHAVATREALREQGLVAEHDKEMPPTWDRIDLDGQHERRGIRSRALRVLTA